MYGGGRDYSAAIYGNIDINLENCTLSGDLYGGGKYGNCEITPLTYIQYKDDPSTDERDAIGEEKNLSELDTAFGNNINIDGKSLTERQSDKIGGDVNVRLTRTHVKGNVFGSGMGQSQVLDVRNQMQITEGWYDAELIGEDGIITKEENIYPEVAEGWTNPIGGYPSYSDTDKRVLVNAWRTGTYTTNAKEQISYYNYHSYASLSLATVRNVDILITDNSEIGTSGNANKGNVYGGGSIAKVLENTKITINNSKVWGDVYGGGDGVTIPDKVKVYWPENDSTYVPAVNYEHAFYTGSYGDVKWTEQKPKATDKQYIEYEWSNEASLLEGDNKGIDHTRRLLYSPNTQGLGSVEGNCTVVIYGDATDISGTVFGGGNQGSVGGNTSVTIAGGKIKEVFGGGNAADVLGNVTLNISDYDDDNDAETPKIGGNAVITDAYGGNNKSGSVGGTITTTLSSGSITNHIYGGGNEADYAGVTNLVISGGNVGTPGTPQESTGTVTGCAYGGGRNARVHGAKSVISGGQLRAFVGGSYNANITPGAGQDGNAVEVFITGENKTVITTFMGGNDFGGSVNGDIHIVAGLTESNMFEEGTTIINADAACPDENIVITNFFGGGNQADYNWGSDWKLPEEDPGYQKPIEGYKGITITAVSGKYYQVFGGGVMADVTNVRTAFYGGEYNFIYGGGFMGTSRSCATHIRGGKYDGQWLTENQETLPTDKQGGYIFGGGYEGYTENTIVYMEQLTSDRPIKVTHSVFGGGFGEDAGVGKSKVLVMSGEVLGSIYGGGFAGQSCVDINNQEIETAEAVVEIYGGEIGKGTTSNDGTEFVKGNVYGGGYQGKSYNTHVDIVAYHNSDHTTKLSLGGNVYGGGHQADVDGDTHIHFLTGSIDGNVYGGGREGHVNGNTYVDILAGTIGKNVYGGGFLGKAENTHVLVSDKRDTIAALGIPYLLTAYDEVHTKGNADRLIHIEGDVFGGGEGQEAIVDKNTIVKIDTEYDFSANEVVDEVNAQNPSGKIQTTITGESGKSYIAGNVYGGGDFGTIGNGTINHGSNILTNVEKAGQTHVSVDGGHIRGSVFGGGNGVPKNNTYSIYMGTVFGSTQVDINNGHIEGNIYGGGKQARLYQAGAATNAATVNITEAQDSKIAIGGSVFGGGDRGNAATTNATVATTVGNVVVNIANNSERSTSQIYFYKASATDGGVYGEGNLCLVKGSRKVYIKNFTIGDNQKLKTFYSLQRADDVILENSDIVLLGAIDLVEEGDTTNYSINRVSNLQLAKGSTIKLSEIVKGLGSLYSDINYDTVYIDKGHNGTNNWTTDGGTHPDNMLTQEQIDAYINNGHKDSDGVTISEERKNTVCVANGLYLEVMNVNGTYGPVKGLFTLQLLNANPGEGGGFVYGNKITSTGDFICETHRGYIYTPRPDITEAEFNAALANNTEFFTRNVGGAYDKADTYESNKLYYEGELSSAYMTVVDELSGVKNDQYTYYMWYINGPVIQYNTAVTGFIGASETSYTVHKAIPQHAAPLDYILYGIDIKNGNNKFAESVSGADRAYDLVQHSDNLEGQQIALELKIGDPNYPNDPEKYISIGFLKYTDDGWVIDNGNDDIAGYKGDINTGVLAKNILRPDFISEDDNGIVSVVLHKSPYVETETENMNVLIELSLYSENGSPYADGSSTLIFDTTVNIKRLVPTQKLFADDGKAFDGVNESAVSINITQKSSFTANYITRYIPIAFPREGEKSLRWTISTKSYTYFLDATGATGTYFTFDKNATNDGDKIVNGTKNLHYDSKKGIPVVDSDGIPVSPDDENRIFVEEGIYKAYVRLGEEDIKLITFATWQQEKESSVFPKNTKIIMVDYTDSKDTPEFFYYICESDMEVIELEDFRYMATGVTIKKAADDNESIPPFMNLYRKQDSVESSEQLLFTVDFSQVDFSDLPVEYQNMIDEEGHFKGLLNLNHLYGKATEKPVDFMDYVKTNADNNGNVSYERAYPLSTVYAVNTAEDVNGLDRNSYTLGFGDAEYYDIDTAKLNVSFRERDDWVNTQLDEGSYSLQIELVKENGADAGGNPIYDNLSFPIGMSFKFDGEVCVPGNQRKYVIIPIDAPGDYVIEVENLLYSLKDVIGGENARFRITLYSSPDSRYFQHLTTTLTDITGYAITTNPVYSLKVTAMAEQYVYAGDTLGSFNVETSAEPSDNDRAKVDVKLLKKIDGNYGEIPWSGIFEGTKTEPFTAKSGRVFNDLKIKTTAGSGTYRLEFAYGGHVEYLNFIIGEKNNALPVEGYVYEWSLMTELNEDADAAFDEEIDEEINEEIDEDTDKGEMPDIKLKIDGITNAAVTNADDEQVDSENIFDSEGNVVFKVLAADGYVLPDSFTVTVNGIDYEVETFGESESNTITFDMETGLLTIPNNMLGDETNQINIRVDAILKTEDEEKKRKDEEDEDSDGDDEKNTDEGDESKKEDTKGENAGESSTDGNGDSTEAGGTGEDAADGNSGSDGSSGSGENSGTAEDGKTDASGDAAENISTGEDAADGSSSSTGNDGTDENADSTGNDAADENSDSTGNDGVDENIDTANDGNTTDNSDDTVLENVDDNAGVSTESEENTLPVTSDSDDKSDGASTQDDNNSSTGTATADGDNGSSNSSGGGGTNSSSQNDNSTSTSSNSTSSNDSIDGNSTSNDTDSSSSPSISTSNNSSSNGDSSSSSITSGGDSSKSESGTSSINNTSANNKKTTSTDAGTVTDSN